MPVTQYITIQQAAERLNLSYQTIQKMIREGKIRAYQFGRGNVLIDPEELDEDVKRHPAAVGIKAEKPKPRPRLKPLEVFVGYRK